MLLFVVLTQTVAIKEILASSYGNAYVYRGNWGELHSHQAKIGVNLP